MTQGFCVRCRKMVEMKSEKEVRYKNGRLAKKGICPECGGTVCKTVPEKKGILETLLPKMPEPKKEEEKKEEKGQPAPV